MGLRTYGSAPVPSRYSQGAAEAQRQAPPAVEDRRGSLRHMTVGLDRRVDTGRFEPSPGGARRREEPAPAPTRHASSSRLRSGVLVVLGVQLVVMAVVSFVEYHRYALGVGFGTYSQAWVAIAHGHLDPV